MYKIASIALSAALGIAGIAQSTPAESRPEVTLGVQVPGVAVAEPAGFVPAYYRPYRYARGPYYRPGFRYERGRFYRHWDRC